MKLLVKCSSPLNLFSRIISDYGKLVPTNGVIDIVNLRRQFGDLQSCLQEKCKHLALWINDVLDGYKQRLTDYSSGL